MPKKTVLFVCRGNRFRSRIAEEIFNKTAPENFRAESAGTVTGKHNCRSTRKVMREIGIEVSRKKPRKLSQHMAEKAWKIIKFDGVRIPYKSETWPVKDCHAGDDRCIRKGRIQIEKRIKKLINSLA